MLFLKSYFVDPNGMAMHDMTLCKANSVSVQFKESIPYLIPDLLDYYHCIILATRGCSAYAGPY